MVMISHLLWLQITDDAAHCGEDLIDESACLVGLNGDKVAAALDGDFNEGVAGHVLDTVVRLVHKFEEFVHHRLEEFPVGAQEARILSHHIHDIGGNNSLVVLALLLFT